MKTRGSIQSFLTAEHDKSRGSRAERPEEPLKTYIWKDDN